MGVSFRLNSATVTREAENIGNGGAIFAHAGAELMVLGSTFESNTVPLRHCRHCQPADTASSCS